MRKIIYDSGFHKPEMNPSESIINMFKDDYGILQTLKD